MFRSMRRARFGQFALMIAGFLAVAGSFGLHPEPEPAPPADTASSAPVWASARPGGEAPHECLACLAHRSLSLPRLAAVVLQPGSAVKASAVAAPAHLAKLDAHPREGRAPPTLI
jgi:hypothetical protein